ncbi:MAG: hypothetical protein SW833_28525 [Cyanobacteriota bacterium]|nr:hypothetical protein [Cyanobacteriota bacterium]
MTDPTIQAVINQTVALILYYGFETGEATAVELVASWLEVYQPIWVRFAVIEALHQGRYKAVSIEQILAFWVRRGQPTYHFNHEFESLVCRKIPLFPTCREEGEQVHRILAAAWSAAGLEAETTADRDLLEDFIEADQYFQGLSAADGTLDGEEDEDAAIASTPPKPLHRPIHKFTPSQDSSDFYHKLKNMSSDR